MFTVYGRHGVHHKLCFVLDRSMVMYHLHSESCCLPSWWDWQPWFGALPGWRRNWDTSVTPVCPMPCQCSIACFFLQGNLMEYNIKCFFWWNIIMKDLGILLSVSDHGSMNWMSVWSVGTFVQEPNFSETETNFQKSQFLQPRRHVWAMFWNHHVVVLFLKFLIGYARWVLCFVVRNEFVKLLKDLFHWTSREAQHIHCNLGDLYRWKNGGANLCKIPKWVSIPLDS